MHFEPMGAILANRLTREHVGSALPDAPIVAEQNRKPRRIRVRLAGGLHRIAFRLETPRSVRVRRAVG